MMYDTDSDIVTFFSNYLDFVTIQTLIILTLMNMILMKMLRDKCVGDK